MMNSEIKRIANSYAEEFCSDAIYPSHLFKAVLHKDMGLVHFLETELDKDYFYLQDWADIQMQLSPRATRPSSDLELSDEGQAVMDEAFSYQEKFGMSSCEPICVLASLVTPGVGFTFDQLKTLPLNATSLCPAKDIVFRCIASSLLNPICPRICKNEPKYFSVSDNILSTCFSSIINSDQISAFFIKFSAACFPRV